jgi:hypothetical protein
MCQGFAVSRSLPSYPWRIEPMRWDASKGQAAILLVRMALLRQQ